MNASHPFPENSKRLRFLTHMARHALDKRLRNILSLNRLPVARFRKERIATAFDDIDIYIYYPLVKKPSYPLYLNIHGGGFIVGSAMGDDNMCRMICNRLGVIVINVEYELAPDARYPTQLEQCYGALRWAYRHADALNIDIKKIIIGGHSAGGNLTAAVSLAALRRQEIPVFYQVLLCPLLDLATDPRLKTSADDITKIIPNRVAKYFRICYLNASDSPTDPLISPLYAGEEELKQLPPAIVFVAGSDNLWQEGFQYAEKLKQANVPVTFQRWHDRVHAFILDESERDARKAWKIIFDTLIKAMDEQRLIK
jgi:acetyl esterase